MLRVEVHGFWPLERSCGGSATFSVNPVMTRLNGFYLNPDQTSAQSALSRHTPTDLVSVESIDRPRIGFKLQTLFTEIYRLTRVDRNNVALMAQDRRIFRILSSAYVSCLITLD